MDDRAAIDLRLHRLLTPLLGHTPARWPQSVYDRLRELAHEHRTTELELLRNLTNETRDAVLARLIDATTVAHTAFFRHADQFDHLGRLFRRLSERTPRTISVWCAGCATGEEAYSVALCGEEAGARVDILATDVNPRAIEIARIGRYEQRRTGRLPGPPNATRWEAPPSLRQGIRFEVESLVRPRAAVGKGPFDFILCRNVLIYFAREEVADILAHLAGYLRMGGRLVISPADNVLPLPDCLTRRSRVGFLTVRGHDAPPSSRLSLEVPTVPAPQPTAPAPVEVAARLLGAGELAEAEAVLTDLLNSDPDHAAGWFLLGEVLLQRGERAQARAAFERVGRCTRRTTGEFDTDTLVWAAARRAKALAAESA